MTRIEDQLPPGTPLEHNPEKWFPDHYDGAAGQIVSFLEADGIPLAGTHMADIGSGDGIIDLGVFHKAEPAQIVGYDVKATDRDELGRLAELAGVTKALPQADQLAFVKSEAKHIPAASDSFDVVYSWSTFEHVSHPTEMFAEIRRILRPTGVLFLQIWPLYYSMHGGHLWYSIREPYPHLRLTPDEIQAQVAGKPATDPRRDAWDEFQSLNRLTVDDLHRSLLVAGLRATKVELTSDTVHLPLEVGHVPISALAVSGIKLLAVPH